MPTLFFSTPKPHGLNETYLTHYQKNIEEAMAWLNQTCRYRKATETHFRMPSVFVLDAEKNVHIGPGVAMTEALDSMFLPLEENNSAHDRWIIDCLVATALVSAQAARKVFGDEAFNHFVDRQRNGRDRPIPIRNCTHRMFLGFGIVFMNSPPAQNILQTEIRFGYMSQLRQKDFMRKHMHLSSVGFHHIILPDERCVLFSPENKGVFASQYELAQYLVKEMNVDISSEEWCAWIDRLKIQHQKNRAMQQDSAETGFVALKRLANHDISSFIALLQELGPRCKEYTLENGAQSKEEISEILKQKRICWVDEVDSIAVVIAQLYEHILPLNTLKTIDSPETYETMIKNTVVSAFRADGLHEGLKNECTEEAPTPVAR